MTKTKSKSKGRGLVYKSQSAPLELVDHVAGLVNPFSEEARDKKIHDANASKTFTFRSVSTIKIPVNTAGDGYAQFNPTINSALRALKGETSIVSGSGGDEIAGSPAFFNNNVTEYSDLQSSGARYRIVSWGIRLLSTENALDAKGQMLIREMDHNAVAGTKTLTYTDNYKTVPVTHNMDYSIIPNHIGEAYQSFIPMNTTYTSLLADNALEPGYKSVHITLSGLTPGTGSGNPPVFPTVITAEVVYNLEILPLLSSIGMRLATNPAPHSHDLLAAVHNTRTAAALVHKTPSLWSKIKNVASNVLRTGTNFLLNRYGGQAGAALTSMLAGAGDNLVRRVTARARPMITM
jgi:hypothetical protein